MLSFKKEPSFLFVPLTLCFFVVVVLVLGGCGVIGTGIGHGKAGGNSVDEDALRACLVQFIEDTAHDSRVSSFNLSAESLSSQRLRSVGDLVMLGGWVIDSGGPNTVARYTVVYEGGDSTVLVLELLNQHDGYMVLAWDIEDIF